MKISYHGHAVVKIETNGTTILIDPFINGNPLTDLQVDDVKADVIILTHGHNDHVGDTVAIAKRNDSLVIGAYELVGLLAKKGVAKTYPINVGGGATFEFGKIKMTLAFHGSAYAEEDGTVIYTGMPSGILFTAEGKTIYHAGDTSLFSDMKLIGEMNNIDVAFLPIGDCMTMGSEDAILAAQWLQAKTVVPIHFNTFPLIEQNPHAFAKELPNIGKVLEAGEMIEL